MSKKLLALTMVAYIGTKSLSAVAMTRGEYNEYRGWEIPSEEDPSEQGYLVEYADGGKPNDERHKGYISWSPKDVFEKCYRQKHAVDDAKSVWGSEIHTDGNGIKVTHNEFMDSGIDTEGLDHGHFYDIQVGNRKVAIDFQHGPVKEQGVNGVTSEALLAIAIHRTKILNSRFPCDENKCAISYMENALALFEQRTKERQSRGVEGHNKV